MRLVVLGLFVLALFSCGQQPDEGMFNAHVYAATDSGVTNIRSGRVHCMHCPMYFRFNSSQNIAQEIIKKHHLTEIDAYPEVLKGLNRMIAADADWWDLQDFNREGERVFWVRYMPKGSVGEPAFRIMVTDDSTTYFITTGHFNEVDYVQQKSTKLEEKPK